MIRTWLAVSMKETCCHSQPVRADVALGGHAGVEIGDLLPCNPLAQHQRKAGQSSELKTQEESAPKETEMQSCCRSWDVRSTHREISFHLVKTFHSDCYQSISFCLAFSLAVMGHPGYLSRKFLKETSFRVNLCDKNISTLSKSLIPSYILKQNLPRCALWICTKLTASPCLWLTPALRVQERKPGICYPLLSSSCYFTLLWQRPMQLSFMSLCHLPERNLHPSHQKSLSLSRYLWAEPAAHPSHLLPRPRRPFSLKAISSTHTVAAFPSISQPLHPVFSAFQMVPLLLTLCIAHQLEKAHGRAVPSTKSPPAGLREQPGTTRVNSEVVSVQLLPLITTLDPSQKKTS